MSGFLGNILGGLMGGQDAQGGAQDGAPHQAVGGLLADALNAAGGVNGLMARFDQAGLGDKVRSWIGDGHNLPVSPQEILQVFPPDQIDSFAQRHGLPAGAASQVLAHLLPHAVDQATPEGAAADGTPKAVDDQVDFGALAGRLLKGFGA
jgi:uncharacterized protein YidB (DUF937 family)